MDKLVFHLLVLLAEALGLAVCVMMGYWFGHFQKGYSWRSNPKVEFNYHPLFMTIGLLFFYGNGIIVYRIFPAMPKRIVKIGHASIHFGAILFSIVGLIAAFDSHNLVSPPIPNMYSMHSWIGIITVVLFCLQWAFGLAAFLVPGLLSDHLKRKYKSHHDFWGVRIFGLAVATALMGIVERTIFQKDRIKYSKLPSEGVLINCMGVLICAYTIVIMYLAMKSKYKRGSVEPEQPTETTHLNEEV